VGQLRKPQDADTPRRNVMKIYVEKVGAVTFVGAAGTRAEQLTYLRFLLAQPRTSLHLSRRGRAGGSTFLKVLPLGLSFTNRCAHSYGVNNFTLGFNLALLMYF
jgi:hypothetical protein